MPRIALSAFPLALLLLAGCSRAPPSPGIAEPSVAAPSRTPTRAQVDAFRAQGPEPALQALRPLDYWLHYAVLRGTGVEEALGGEAQAVAALRALATDYERQARGAEADVPRLWPAAFTGEGMGAGFLGLGLGAFGGLLVGGSIQGMVAGMSDERLAELASAGPANVGGDKGMSISVGQDGSIDQRFDYEGKVAEGLNGRIKLKMSMPACPDANGRIRIESDIDSSVQVTGKAGTGGYVRSHFVYDRWVDDDARLLEGNTGSASDMRIRLGGFENYEGQHVELSAGWTREGKETFQNHHESGYSLFRMDEVARTQQLLQGAQLLQALMAEVMLRGTPWESGRCVELQATSSPARRTGIRPNTAFDLEAMPRARADGAPAGGTVTATLSGGASLQPSSGKVPADARYAYAGPEQEDAEASIAFEARSRRGVGRATLAFDTRRVRAYAAAGGLDDFHGTGTIYNLAEPFTISGGGNTVTFTPTSDAGGSYRYAGNMGGIGVYGNGRYTVSADAGGGTLTGSGNGCVKTPMGTRCGSGTERYVLTPIAACE